MTRADLSTEEAAITKNDLTIGSIAQSHSQMDYVVEVYREHERETPPEKQDYEFGQLVYSKTTVRGDEYALVGVVYDSQLVDPDQGREGPRLSNPDQEMFVPGYIDEKRTLLGIAFLGYANIVPASDAGAYNFTEVTQEMPRWTLDIDKEVSKLSSGGFNQFHLPNDTLRIQYYDRLIATAGQFGAEVTLTLIDRLRHETAADEDILDVIEQKIRWEASADRGVVR
ncbi:hypothetical protein [Halomicrococcus sp. NG-SE-24]|uniref:hypothetical protein n=1 Tax=Halomicrococcus sp. NG-SE-24 TaxID=3436928 RepID=UPI003D974E0F